MLRFGRTLLCAFVLSLLLTGCHPKRAFTGQEVAPLITNQSNIALLKQRIYCDRLSTLGVVDHQTSTCPYGTDKNVKRGSSNDVDKHLMPVPNPLTDQERNNVQEALMAIADEHFDRTKNHLIAGQNALTFSAEVTGVTLSAVSAIIGDAETKTIVSTASALVQSTDASIKKDFFANKTSSALINQMSASRADVAADIVRGQNQPLDKYGFEAALRDAVRYDKAGLIHDALIALDSTAAGTRDCATKQLAETKLSFQENKGTSAIPSPPAGTVGLQTQTGCPH